MTKGIELNWELVARIGVVFGIVASLVTVVLYFNSDEHLVDVYLTRLPYYPITNMSPDGLFEQEIGSDQSASYLWDRSCGILQNDYPRLLNPKDNSVSTECRHAFNVALAHRVQGKIGLNSTQYVFSIQNSGFAVAENFELFVPDYVAAQTFKNGVLYPTKLGDSRRNLILPDLNPNDLLYVVVWTKRPYQISDSQANSEPVLTFNGSVRDFQVLSIQNEKKLIWRNIVNQSVVHISVLIPFILLGVFLSRFYEGRR
jgi:hypothetical protein